MTGLAKGTNAEAGDYGTHEKKYILLYALRSSTGRELGTIGGTDADSDRDVGVLEVPPN